MDNELDFIVKCADLEKSDINYDHLISFPQDHSYYYFPEWSFSPSENAVTVSGEELCKTIKASEPTLAYVYSELIYIRPHASANSSASVTAASGGALDASYHVNGYFRAKELYEGKSVYELKGVSSSEARAFADLN